MIMRGMAGQDNAAATGYEEFQKAEGFSPSNLA